jgi:hypothetical protein
VNGRIATEGLPGAPIVTVLKLTTWGLGLGAAAAKAGSASAMSATVVRAIKSRVGRTRDTAGRLGIAVYCGASRGYL